MKKEDIIIFFLVCIIGLLIWTNRRSEQSVVFEINNDWIEKIAKEREEWGYANGLAMPLRIIGEQNYFPNLPQKSCEEIVGEMYDLAQRIK